MEKDVSTSPLRRWGLILGIPAALFILIFVGLVLFDMGTGFFYNVMLTRAAGKSLTEELNAKERRSGGTKNADVSTTGTRTTHSTTPQTTSSMLRLRAEASLRSVDSVLRRLANTTATGTNTNWDRAMIIPEGTFKKPEFISQARQLNEGYARVLRELHDFCRDEAWRDYRQGMDRLIRTAEDCSHLMPEINQAWKNMLLDDRSVVRNSKDLQQFQKIMDSALNDWYGKFWSLHDQIEAAQIMVCVVHEHWLDGADLMRFSRQADNWTNEVFLLSQMGARGQALIARRSAERNWKALKRSVMSIGPDFKWPYRERMD